MSQCGYQPSDLQTAYNMKPLYQVGLNGTGETIAVVDAYGWQRARHPLGQAVAYPHRLPPGAITDVLATPTSAQNGALSC
jgi:hypothetical protein